MKSVLAVLYLVSGLALTEAASQGCPCAHEKDCDHPAKDLGFKKEVFAFSDGTTDVETWGWDSITSLIVPSNFSISNKQQSNTMCLAHSKGRKFGITVEVDFSGKVNATSEEAAKWVKFVAKQQQDWHAEIITINLVPYFSMDIDSFQHDHVELARILSNMKAEIANNTEIVKVACIISWKPPCAESDASCDFTSLSQDACDFFIINSDSFTDLDDVKCRARANIPLSKLLFGISEYNSHNVPNSRIILGVAWHGYDYMCQSITNDICSLREVTQGNSTKCDFSTRRRISIGSIIKSNLTQFYIHQFDMLYNAPFFNYYNATDQHQHQVWFEDSGSLGLKYKLVTELNLKGLALLYGDDLSLSSDYPNTEHAMWTWPGQEIHLTTSPEAKSVFHYADTISGVAVGCLVLGVVIGTAFACVMLRKRARRGIAEPFARDKQVDINSYTDEDFSL